LKSFVFLTKILLLITTPQITYGLRNYGIRTRVNPTSEGEGRGNIIHCLYMPYEDIILNIKVKKAYKDEDQY